MAEIILPDTEENEKEKMTTAEMAEELKKAVEIIKKKEQR